MRSYLKFGPVVKEKSFEENYSKTCVKWSLSKRQKMVFKTDFGLMPG